MPSWALRGDLLDFTGTPHWARVDDPAVRFRPDHWLLVEDGRIRLDDPVSRFIPAFRDVKVAVPRAVSPGSPPGTPAYYTVPPDRPITVLDLLTHTGGLVSGPISTAAAAPVMDRHRAEGVKALEDLAERDRRPRPRQLGHVRLEQRGLDVGRVARLRVDLVVHEHAQRGQLRGLPREGIHHTAHEADHLLTTPRAELKRVDRLRLMGWPAPILVFFYVLFAKRAVLDGAPGWFYAWQRTYAEILLAMELLDRRMAAKGKGAG